MKSKLIIVIGIILLFNMVGVCAVIAGDLPESALQYSDYCFIGSVEEINNNITTIKISQVLFGDYNEETVEIVDLKYSTQIRKADEPKIGDYCAVVVKKESDVYKVYEGLAAKSDSLDKKKLKLKSTNEFIIRMNGYINNGWYSNDTINMIKQKISGDKVSTSAISTPVVTPTAIPTEMPTAIVSTNVKEVSSANTNFEGGSFRYILTGGGLLLAAVVGIGIFIGKGKKAK